MDISEIIRLSFFDEAKDLVLSNEQKTELLLRILTVYLKTRMNIN